MSSFKRSPINTTRCIYCNSNFPNNIKTFQGSICSNCRLWQPRAHQRIVMDNSKSKLKYIKNIFVINLEKDISRWNKYMSRINANVSPIDGRKIYRFIGVDGSDKNKVFTIANHMFGEERATKLLKKQWKEVPGSIGCYLSHLSLWKYLYDNYRDTEMYILIMEDDSYFAPYALQNIDKIINYSENKLKWDLIYFGHNQIRGKQVSSILTKPFAGDMAHKLNTGFYGYVVRIASLKNMIEKLSNFDIPYVDVCIKKFLSKEIHGLFMNQPVIIHNKNFTSSRKNKDEVKLIN